MYSYHESFIVVLEKKGPREARFKTPPLLLSRSTPNKQRFMRNT
jgi:hypothetical protein